MSEITRKALEIADLVDAKQKAYGDSFGKSIQIINVLYPDGIPKRKLKSFLTMIRVIDKLFRIATDEDVLGENPWQDIAGYALLECARQKQKEERHDG